MNSSLSKIILRYSLVAALFHVNIGSYGQVLESLKGPYVALVPLIGKWESKFGDRSSTRNFSWGYNQSLIRYTSTRPAGDNQQIPEQEALIVYNAVKNVFTNLGSYLDSGNTMYEGEIVSAGDNRIERHITVFYREGSQIPWSSEKVAPKGGKLLEFRFVWVFIDQDTMTEKFQMKKDGKWINPISEDINQTFTWTRSK